jgi:hypothetical protein
MLSRIRASALLIVLMLATAASAETSSHASRSDAASGSQPPLAAVFAAEDGGAYFVSELADGPNRSQVFWFAEHPGRDYAHVFEGTRQGRTIKGKYWSVPKGRQITKGIVTLDVQSTGALRVRSQTGGFPAQALRVTTIAAIQDGLPGKRGPGFTGNRVQDLDGVFDLGSFRFYVRQAGELSENHNRMVFYVERHFAPGTRPEAALVFVGERTGNRLSGSLVPVPKGALPAPRKASMITRFAAQIHANRTLSVTQDLEMLGGRLFGAGPIQPVLPEIRVPIKFVLRLLSLFEDRLSVRLDGYDKDGRKLEKGSYIKLFGEPDRFTIPHVVFKPKRYTFINDVQSENVDFDAIGPNLARLTVLFEENGRELKRYCGSCAGRRQDGRGKDNQMKDWDLQNIRLEVDLKLVNFGDGISYKATEVRWRAQVADTPHIDAIEDIFSRKLRDEVQDKALMMLNDDKKREIVRDAIDEGLRKLPEYLEKYAASPYSVTGMLPTRVSISGDDIVLHFDR